MGHNNLQATHEAIHTGLSGLNNDEKWQDMLNFRCRQGRTTVVPHKFRLLPPGCGFHTLIPAENGHVLAIGKCGSVGFVGADNLQPYRLWRLEQKFLRPHTGRGEQSQRLIVQGQFTGDKSVKLRVALIDGKLTPFWAVVPEEPPAPEPAPIDYGCLLGEISVSVRVTVLDAFTNAPISFARVQFNRFGIVQYDEETNSLGWFFLASVFTDNYSLLTEADGYGSDVREVRITGNTSITIHLLPAVALGELPCGVSFSVESQNFYNLRLDWEQDSVNTSLYKATRTETIIGEGAVIFTFSALRVENDWVFSENTNNENVSLSSVTYATDCSAWGEGEDGPNEPPSETLEVEFNYYDYTPNTPISDFVFAYGTIDSGIFTGTCILGNFTLAWNEVEGEWILSLDVPTAATGTGVNASYEPLAEGSTDRENPPASLYLEIGGGDFPNWSATVL